MCTSGPWLGFFLPGCRPRGNPLRLRVVGRRFKVRDAPGISDPLLSEEHDRRSAGRPSRPRDAS